MKRKPFYKVLYVQVLIAIAVDAADRDAVRHRARGDGRNQFDIHTNTPGPRMTVHNLDSFLFWLFCKEKRQLYSWLYTSKANDQVRA
jgi:hypothetical protein